MNEVRDNIISDILEEQNILSQEIKDKQTLKDLETEMSRSSSATPEEMEEFNLLLALATNPSVR